MPRCEDILNNRFFRGINDTDYNWWEVSMTPLDKRLLKIYVLILCAEKKLLEKMLCQVPINLSKKQKKYVSYDYLY
jgi:hypothetical protein